MLKMLITDTADGFCRALIHRLGKAYDIKTAADGKRTLRLLRSLRPDLLVLELQLSGLDGLSVLRQACVEGIRPRVLVLTTMLSDYVIENLQQLQVDYVMLKPCDMAATQARLAELAERARQSGSRKTSRERLLSDMLMLLGIGASMSGHRYLYEAVLMQAEAPDSMITKELYPAVMRRCGAASTDNVERNIRVAIHNAWRERNDSVWSYYFPPDRDGQIPRPTNQELVCRLAEVLRLQDV